MQGLPGFRAGAAMSICAALVLAACGGGGSASAPVPAENATPTTQPGTSTTAAGPAMDKAIAAAKQAAANDPLCATSALGDFYWEIGDATSSTPLVANSEGGGSVTATSHFGIASASKWVFGAYVLQKQGIEQVRANPVLRDGLRFLSGYTGFNDDACLGKTTVGACNAAGNISSPDPNTVGRFDYDGGHDQKLAAIDLGLGGFTSKQLDQEYQATLGLSSGINMAPLDPLIPGGLQASATDYAHFLRKLMNQQLVIGAHLGEDAVCADPLTCPSQVAYSPIQALGEPWFYSYNYWVESEHGNGTVDAYSSPGKFGFYPWITPDRKYYGILSRHDTQPVAYGVSVKCGRQIRKAFLAALAQ